MAGKKIWLGMLVMALVFGMTAVGCDDEVEPEVKKGGTLTVTNTTADVYEYEWFGPSGRSEWWGNLYGYRSVTLGGHENGVYELKYRKLETPHPSWTSKYGNLSGGVDAKLNIP